MHCGTAVAGRRSHSPASPKAREGGAGGAPGTRAEIVLQLVVQAMVRQIHPAAQGEPHSGAVGHALEEAVAHGEPTQVQDPSRNFSCGEIPCCSRDRA